MTDELDDRLERIYEIYGNDLEAFFRDARAAGIEMPPTKDERMAELEARLAGANATIEAFDITVQNSAEQGIFWLEKAARAEAQLAEANAHIANQEEWARQIIHTIAELEAQLAKANARAADADAYEYTASEAEARAADATQWARKFAEQRDEAESVNGQLLGLIRTARAQLNDLLIDEDLDDEKLREASEGLLPNIVDGFSNALQAAAARPAESEAKECDR